MSRQEPKTDQPPTIPRAPWLRPDDHTDPAWYDKHNERL